MGVCDALSKVGLGFVCGSDQKKKEGEPKTGSIGGQTVLNPRATRKSDGNLVVEFDFPPDMTGHIDRMALSSEVAGSLGLTGWAPSGTGYTWSKKGTHCTITLPPALAADAEASLTKSGVTVEVQK